MSEALELRLAALEKEVREIGIIAASPVGRTKQQKEDAAMVATLRARCRKLEEKLLAVETTGLASDAKRIRAIVGEELRKGLPEYFAGASEPLVDMLVDLKAEAGELPKQIAAAEDRINSNSGAAALASKNAAKSTTTAAADYLIGQAYHFAFGPAQKGDTA